MEKSKYIKEMNPTFLFTWKGTRTRDEENYHGHDFPELAYVISGKGKYRIDDRLYNVSEGDLIVLNPGMKHQALVSDRNNPCTEFFVGFTDVEFVGYGPNELPFSGETPIIHLQGDLQQRVLRIVSAMETESTVNWEGRYYMQKSYLMQLLLYLSKEELRPQQRETGVEFESVNRKYIVEKMITYLTEHYADKISLDQIAANIYLSPYYISKIFKTETGETPIHFVIQLRLEKAKELLENGWEGSIEQVAQKVGYEDAFHFSKSFKKRFGETPFQIKRKGLEKEGRGRK